MHPGLNDKISASVTPFVPGDENATNVPRPFPEGWELLEARDEMHAESESKLFEEHGADGT